MNSNDIIFYINILIRIFYSGLYYMSYVLYHLHKGKRSHINL